MSDPARSETLSSRIRWLWGLRWIAGFGLAAMTLFVHFALGLTLAWQALLVLAGILLVYNALLTLWLSRAGEPSSPGLRGKRTERLACSQIAVDILILTLCLHFSGGVENPFVMLYVLPPVIASVLLSSQCAYLLAGWTTVLFLAMACCHAVWPSLHYPIGGHLPVALFREPVFIVGESMALAIAVFVSVYLAGSVATKLRRHEQELAEAGRALEARTAQLAEKNRELQELETTKSRFLGLAAHQLRGPLAVTEGCLACACDGYETDPAKQAEFLKRARIRVQGMLEIVRDLLTLAGTHTLRSSTKLSAIAVDEVAGRVVDQNMDFAASRHVDLVFQPGAHDAEVVADERALTNVIGNLVSNAIKYTREDGHVKVATRVAGSRAVCEVIDDGIGIPDADKENLFKEFFRAGNARASGLEGTGLGLAIVKEIVDRLGGTIRVESLENLGTCMIVSFPCRGSAHPAEGGEPAEVERAGEVVSFGEMSASV